MLMSESFEKRGKDLTTEARDLLIERAENLLRLFSRIVSLPIFKGQAQTDQIQADERDEIMSTIADNPEIEAEVFQNTWYIQMKDIQHWANLNLEYFDGNPVSGGVTRQRKAGDLGGHSEREAFVHLRRKQLSRQGLITRGLEQLHGLWNDGIGISKTWWPPGLPMLGLQA
ncbi:hypothetical protein BKA81DRAFT_357579 [Phyllosticta paracitricarpa]